ncbi:hypothetical protein VTL71DRAFT_8813 [Oculimacula yallundae]|uniref:Protein kinase domain-containing protein n=1 Tax=Oculimacula yallundae TaxID=86028 RepID=A0ABR4CYN5_9HELO
MTSLHPNAALPATPRPVGSLEEFEAMLADCKRKSVIHKPPREFVIETRLLAWFREEFAPGRTNAGRLLQDVYGTNHPPNLIKNLLFVMNTAEDCWLIVFAILLQLKKGRYIETFWRIRILDRSLPITQDNLRSSLNDTFEGDWNEEQERFVEGFFSLQYQLLTTCSLNFVDGGVFDPNIILPVLTYEPVNNNKQQQLELGPEKVFQIEVPYECIPKKILQNVKSKPYKMADNDNECHRFAIKVLTDKKEYEQEYFAYGALKGREGIVQCLGSWELKKTASESEFHLLLEYGHYDLHEYFENYPHPSLPRDIIQFWKDLSRVAVALEKIHNVEITVEGHTTSWLGWHLDIKPENILFCKGGWKIADPGFARFVRRLEAKKDDNDLPVIPLSGGTAAYGPPEQTGGHGELVSQRFDIWSLGCVFSEAATWLLLGRRGVEQFRLVRKSLENGNHGDVSICEPRGDDCFHAEMDTSKAVTDWHDYLRNSLRKGDQVTEAILDFVQKNMLVRLADKRISSRELVVWLKTTIESAEKDQNLSKYQPEKYFHTAFKAEQRKTAEDWANPPTSTDRRSNRYKSMRFEHSSPDGPTMLDNLAYDQANMHTPLLSYPCPSPYRGMTVSSQMTHDVSVIPSSAFDAGARERTRQLESSDVERFDYWDAIQYLESIGWISTGTLERPPEPKPSVRPSIPPRSQTSMSSPTKVKTANSRSSLNLDSSSRSPRYNSMGNKSMPSNTPRINNAPKFNNSSSQYERPRGFGASDTRKTLSSVRAHPNVVCGSTSNHESLAKYKYADFNEFLDKRDIVFLLDNGSTMGKYWPWARDLVAVLVALLHGQDDNGMEIYFTSSTKTYGPFTEPNEFVSIINQMNPKTRQSDNLQEQGDNHARQEKADDIRKVLGRILDKVGEETYHRKLTLIILTDGVWKGITEKRTVAEMIVSKLEMWYDKALLKEMMQDRGVSLQFVQFGNDPQASAVFGLMDDNLRASDGKKIPDIIDVEPATGNVKKMILGSLSNEWDDGNQTTVASDKSASVVGRNEFLAGISPISGNLSNPAQSPDGRSQLMYEDPSDYTSPTSSKSLFGIREDTTFLVSGMHDTTLSSRGEEPTEASATVPRNMVQTPSKVGPRTVRETKYPSSKTRHGRDLG